MPLEEQLYEANCQGHNTRTSYREPHKYLRTEPQYQGSHGICPKCYEKCKEEIEEYKKKKEEKTNHKA